MLSHALTAAFLYLNGGWQKLAIPHAVLEAGLSGSTCSPMLCLPLFYTRMAGMPNLLVPPAPPEASQGSECSLHSTPAVQICFHTALFSKYGVWGLRPHVHPRPLTFPRLSPASCTALLFPLSFLFSPMGYGAKPHVYPCPSPISPSRQNPPGRRDCRRESSIPCPA